MELLLQQQLPHQQKAIDAIVDVFKGAYIKNPLQFYTNPIFSLNDTCIENNIKSIQKNYQLNMFRAFLYRIVTI